MFTIIGSVIVVACVIGGFLLEHGNLAVLFQPVELLIIGGAAVGGFIIASPLKVMKAVFAGLLKMLTGKGYTKADYLEALTMLGEVFYKIRKEGLVSVEGDVDNPKESAIFTKYPRFFNNHHAIDLVVDTLRTVMTTKIEPNELEALIDAELESHHEELMAPSKSVATVADSLPGLGIVAAVSRHRPHHGKNERAAGSPRPEHRRGPRRHLPRRSVVLRLRGAHGEEHGVLGLGGPPVPHGAQDGHRGLCQRRRTAGGRRVRPAGRPGSR